MSICLPSAHTHTATPFSPLGCVGCPSQCVCSACVVVVEKYTSGTPSRAVPAQSRPSRPVPKIGGSVPDLQLFPGDKGLCVMMLIRLPTEFLTLLVMQFLVFGAALTARRARHGPPQAAGTTPGSVPMDPPPLRL